MGKPRNRQEPISSTQREDTEESLFILLIGVIGVFILKSIFQNDSSKIVSSNADTYLADEDKMRHIREVIVESEATNNSDEVVI